MSVNWLTSKNGYVKVTRTRHYHQRETNPKGQQKLFWFGEVYWIILFEERLNVSWSPVNKSLRPPYSILGLLHTRVDQITSSNC